MARGVAVVLFTDLVGSTELRAWVGEWECGEKEGAERAILEQASVRLADTAETSSWPGRFGPRAGVPSALCRQKARPGGEASQRSVTCPTATKVSAPLL